MPMNQPPMPTSISDSAGRIECWSTLQDEGRSSSPLAMFICEPPLIGSTGHR